MKPVTLCFLGKGNKVLLAEKKLGFGTGFLNGYGGKPEPGETPEQAIVRELKEEAGVQVNLKDLEKMAIIEFYDGPDKGIFECHVYFVKSWKGKPKETEEMGKPQWFSLAALPYEKMWKADQTWLPHVFAGEKIHGKAFYQSGMKALERFEYKPL